MSEHWQWSLLTETAQIPKQATLHSAGFDLYVDEGCCLPANSRNWVSTGIAVEIPAGYVGQIWPRSGLAGKGLDTSAGVVDADYRGEVKVLLVNTTIDNIVIEKGQRIAQIIFVKIAENPTFVCVDNLTGTFRGNRGFGHSGN